MVDKSTGVDGESTSVDKVAPPRSTGEDPVEHVLTTLSTRVDLKTKAMFIERAGELGVSPSTLLKQLIEDYLGRAQPAKPGSIPSVAEAFVRACGTFRMGTCKYNERGICMIYGFDSYKDWPELRPVLVEQGGHFRIRVSPEICGRCDIYYISPAAQNIKKLREAVNEVYKALGGKPPF